MVLIGRILLIFTFIFMMRFFELEKSTNALTLLIRYTFSRPDADWLGYRATSQ